MTEKNAPSQAYLDVRAQQAALGDQLFELTVKSNWLGALSTCYREMESGGKDIYFSEPQLMKRFGRCYVGGSQITYEARAHKRDALGVERIDDDQLKELIEEVLRSELDKYGIVFQWCTRHSWDGSDRVLNMYHQSEVIPPPS